MKKTIVVLASSIKHGGRCIAGKDIETGNWMRPVGDVTGKELTSEQAKYSNPHGRFDIKDLIKIEIEFTNKVPLAHQPENYLFSDVNFVQRYSLNKAELVNYLDFPNDLWGKGDSVDPLLITMRKISITQSLYLIKVSNLKLYLDENQKRRASFDYNNISYDLSVTCRNFDRLLNNEEVHDNILCISLGELFREKHWKIVAAIY